MGRRMIFAGIIGSLVVNVLALAGFISWAITSANNNDKVLLGVLLSVMFFLSFYSLYILVKISMRRIKI